MIERPVIFLKLFVHRVIQKQPVKALFIVPFYKLPEFRAHKAELFAGVRELISVKSAERGKFLLIAAEHLVQHGFFAVHHLVMRVGEDEVFRKGVYHGEGELVVCALAEKRVE